MSALKDRRPAADSYLTLEEAASYLKVRRGTIYSWVKAGKIPGWKVIGQWRFSRQEIDSWVRKQPGRHLEAETALQGTPS